MEKSKALQISKAKRIQHHQTSSTTNVKGNFSKWETQEKKRTYKNKPKGLPFPGGAVVESLPASAGDTGSSPGLGRSHMPRSNWAREPQLLSLRVWSLCSTTREATMVRGPRTAMKSGPHLSQLEKALAQKRGPNTAKNFKKLKKNPKQLRKWP